MTELPIAILRPKRGSPIRMPLSATEFTFKHNML
jgi:hypothetical protein